MDLILTPNPNRFSMFPITHQDIWEAYKLCEASFWTAEEIDLEKDKQDWGKLTADERHFLATTLAFFASSDGIVNENLAAQFYSEVQIPEARAFYGFQIAIESIHSEVYSLLIDTYLDSEAEKDKLYRAIQTISTVEEKAKWAMRWMEKDKASFAERLVAFACVEGISFSSSFCSIYWLKQRGLFPGLTFANELIQRDEFSHAKFAALLYSKLTDKLTQQRIYDIVEGAVQVERNFVRDALPVRLIGINSDSMIQYVEFMADWLLEHFGQPALYGGKNPFPFMEAITIPNKTNFFEARVGAYRKAGVGTTVEQRKFTLEEDF